MASIVIFGGTGYAGSAIGAEAVGRGHSVTAVSPSDRTAPAGVTKRQGSLTDAALFDELVAGADVVVVATRASGGELSKALPSLAVTAAEHGARLGFVGGAGSLLVSEGGPRLVDSPAFPGPHKGEALAHAEVLATLQGTPDDVDWFYVSPPAAFGSHAPGEATGEFRIGGDILLSDADGESYISGADYAKAFVDEIEQPAHRRQRFTVAY
jgi:putative NADH-flavin reductase